MLYSYRREQAPPHPQSDEANDQHTPHQDSHRKRILVAPRRSLSLTQSQKAPRRLFSADGDAAEGDWHATKHYEEDIRRASAAFPKPKAPAHMHRHLKLLLVGTLWPKRQKAQEGRCSTQACDLDIYTLHISMVAAGKVVAWQSHGRPAITFMLTLADSVCAYAES